MSPEQNHIHDKINSRYIVRMLAIVQNRLSSRLLSINLKIQIFSIIMLRVVL